MNSFSKAMLTLFIIFSVLAIVGAVIHSPILATIGTGGMFASLMADLVETKYFR